MIKLLAAYTSVGLLQKYYGYVVTLVEAGLVLRMILDIRKCREQDMPGKAIIRRQKNYLMAGIIIICLSSVIRILRRYYGA